MPPAPPSPARRHGRLWSSIAAAVVLAGGGVATYVALADSGSDHGAASPRAAVEKIVGDINSSDLIGMLDSLAPPEKTAIADPLIKDFDELKRTHVLSSDADLNHVAGATVKIHDLAYGPTVTVNDHVQIVQLTSGTVHIDADLSKLPLSSEFIKQVAPHGLTGKQQETVDIADAVRANDGKPIRIATEKVGGRWYPSICYTIADNATTDSGLSEPKPADAIPAEGADTPVGAVRQLVVALLDGDVAGAIRLASPDELAVLHDYGSVIVDQAGASYSPAPVKIDNLELTSTPGPDGSRYVDLKTVTVRVQDGGPVTVTVDGNCMEMTTPGQRMKRMCPNQVVDQLDRMAKEFGGRRLSEQQRAALQRLVSSAQAGGIITTQSGGKWFVNPVRSLFQETTRTLHNLEENDVLVLVGLLQQFGN
jgi:hypothetical protein